MGLNLAKRLGYTGIGIKVGILDTGVSEDENLPLAGGVSFIGENKDYSDDNGHGTLIAEIINKVAPNAKLYSIKVLNSYGQGSVSSVVRGINWAIAHHLNVINLSFGFKNYYSFSVQYALQNAVQNNIAVVISAGNDGSIGKNSVTFPASTGIGITVAAISKNGKRAYFSSVGNEVELAAPGTHIPITTLSFGYTEESGTSFAAPYVTGMLAILRQAYPSASFSCLRNLLDANALSLGNKRRSKQLGFGLASLKYIL